MGFVYKIVSSMEKIYTSASHVPEMEEKRLSGLKGETVSFQIAYYWDGARKTPGFCQVESQLKDLIHIREVHLVPCEYPCHMKRDKGYQATESGMYPDLLAELNPFGFPLVSGQWHCLWVDVNLEENTPAGAYPIRIKLSTPEKELGTAEMTLEVVDAVLPKLPIPHTEWFHSDCLANYYHVEVFSEEYWRIVEEFVKTAVKHKCTMLLTPVFTPPLDTGVGGERPTVQLVDVTVTEDGYAFGFEKFRRWVEMARRCGIQFFEISHLFSQWGAFATPKIMATKDGVYQKIFGWETKASGPEYADFLHQFLTELKQVLQELDIAKVTYFHISDEPSMEHLENYRAALNVVAEDLKEYPIIDALSNYDFYQMGLVKCPVCALDHIGPFLEEGKRPETLLGYYCTAQCVDVSNRFIAMPGYRTRILGAQLYKYRLAGFLHWGYNFYNSEFSWYPIDPYRCTDSAGAFPSGDPFLVYPGADGKPEESIRLMLMDQAMTDLCAMYLLESLAGRDAVMECMEDGETVTFDVYPQSSVWLQNMRRKINEKIAEAVASH